MQFFTSVVQDSTVRDIKENILKKFAHSNRNGTFECVFHGKKALRL